MCFEGRKGGGDGNTSSPRQGSAAAVSLLTNPGRVWIGGAVLFSFCQSCMKYFGASSQMILKSYSEARELTAWSAESWAFNGRRLCDGSILTVPVSTHMFIHKAFLQAFLGECETFSQLSNFSLSNALVR